jgi:hypothetical protein
VISYSWALGIKLVISSNLGEVINSARALKTFMDIQFTKVTIEKYLLLAI